MSFWKDRLKEPSSQAGVGVAANGVMTALLTGDWRYALASVFFGALAFFMPEAARQMPAPGYGQHPNNRPMS